MCSGGSDYEHSTIAVTFSPTELTKCFSHFSVLNDGVIERNEVFDFCLSSNTTSVLIAKENTVSVVIRNDDGEPFHVFLLSCSNYAVRIPI